MKKPTKKQPNSYVVGYAPPSPNPLVFGAMHFRKLHGVDCCNRMSYREAREAVTHLDDGAIFKLVRVN